MPVFQVTLPFHHTEQDVADAVAAFTGERSPFRILKRSVDARQHRSIKVHYSVSTDLENPADEINALIEKQRHALEKKRSSRVLNPVVVGTGPGGIFCAYWLALHGIPVTLLEQGPRMRQRMRDMALFMKRGILNPASNICMGAGGAGTYSDGKLITRIRSPYIPFVMESFVRFGAPEQIRFVYNPHLGSNKIRRCISTMLDHLESIGVAVRYETAFTGFDFEQGNTVATSRDTIDDCSALFLAIGHSSRSTYALLRANGVAMECKPYAVGVRVEHASRCVNEMQYGCGYDARYPTIETAQYKLAYTRSEDERAVYSFCMCPGGFVLNASTADEGVVTNGMSNSAKSGRFSNAAIVVNVSLDDLAREGFSGIDAGVEFQRQLEERFRASVNRSGSHVLPAQRLVDFLEGKKSTEALRHSCASPAAPAEIHRLLPAFVLDGLLEGFQRFEKKLKSFSTDSTAQIFGVESRTSSPYRILRSKESFTSPSHPNIYPVGEGAGHAGGITSAAVDGIKCAQAFIETLL